MQILMTRVLPGRGSAVAAEVTTAGHQVVTCATAGDPIGCARLQGGQCPFDASQVDVALHLVEDEGFGPALADQGIICAVRRHVPVVVAAAGEEEAEKALFAPWATICAPLGDITRTLAAVAAAPLARHSITATRAANSVLARYGLAESWDVIVRRRSAQLYAEMRTPGGILPDAVRDSAVRVEAVLAELDRTAKGIDVTVVPSAG